LRTSEYTNMVSGMSYMYVGLTTARMAPHILFIHHRRVFPECEYSKRQFPLYCEPHIISIFSETADGSNQLLHLLHSCSCRNLNRPNWSVINLDFRTSLRECLDPVVNRCTRQTLLSVIGQHFFTNILYIQSCPQERRITARCSSVVYSSTVAILTTGTNL
jgi:hypothetical protein